MGKSKLWVLATCMVVITMILASCSQATPTEQQQGTTVTGQATQTTVAKTTTATTATTVVTAQAEMVSVTLPTLDGKTVTIQKEKPQYGGKFIMTLAHRNATDFFDPVISNIGGWLYSINYEYLWGVDWAKGPSGTNEFPNTAAYVPAKFLTGQLAESYKIIDLNTYEVTLKKGIRFQNKPPLNGRELTAQDVYNTVLRGKADPRMSWYFDHSAAALDAWKKAQDPASLDDHMRDLAEKGLKFEEWRHSYIYVKDKYTIVYHNHFAASTDHWRNMESIPIYAKEAVDAAGGTLQDWRNHVSTGPWMVFDCVPNSSVTWKKNPNYWQKDPFFPENQLPYIDTMIGLMIPEEATFLAALRTHKIDTGGVGFNQVENIKKSNPELISRSGDPTGTLVIFMRTDIAPFNDLRVRQALMLGVDQIGILRDYFQGNGRLMTWPSMPFHAEFVPYDQLPEDLKPFWGRDVARAKKLLADAGYPNGFKTTLGSYTDATAIDLNNIVVQQLKDIGVEVTYTNYEGAVHDSILYSRKYPGMHFTWWGNVGPDSVQGAAAGGSPASISNFSNVVDPEAEKFNKWYWSTLDIKEREIKLREENLRIMRLWWWIPLPQGTGAGFWGPWLKGFSGEACHVSGAEPGLGGRWKYTWIDQDLKFKMTGRK